MKHFRFRTALYVLVPAMVINLLSGCGTLTAQRMAPDHRGVELNGPGVTQTVPAGESGGGLSDVREPRVPTTNAAYSQTPWNPSGTQIVASVAIGAAWFFLACVKLSLGVLETLGNGREKP